MICNGKTKSTSEKGLLVHLRTRDIERFSTYYRKDQTKVITPTNHRKSKQCGEPIRIPRNYLLLAQSAEKSRVQGAIGFGFASHWLKNWREIFKPITKHSNCSRVIAFDSNLETTLT